ncbi:MAG TPA: hypothetical protein PKB15_06675 [Acidimicrobiia bacterium]|nr:hypothetical protein [Acidimicrobiia bacterium]
MKRFTSIRRIVPLPVLGIIAIFTLFAIYLMNHTYWAADDFVYMQRFEGQSLNWDLITTPFDNHLVPMFVASWWVIDRIARGNYWVAETFMIFGFIVLQFSVWKLLQCFSLSKKHEYVALSLFASSSIILHNFIWWAAFLSSIVPLILIVNFFRLCILYTREHSGRRLLMITVLFFVASLFFEKMLMYSGVIFLYCVLIENDSISVKKIFTTVQKHKWLWISLISITMALAVAYVSSGALESVKEKPGLFPMISYLKVVWFQFFVPQLFGLRYLNIDILNKPIFTIIFGIVVTVILVGAFLRIGKRSLHMAVFFGIVFVVNESIVAYGRLFTNGYNLGGEIRYHLDSFFLLFVCGIAALAYFRSNRKSRSDSVFEKILMHRSAQSVGYVILAVVILANLGSAYFDLEHSIGYDSLRYRKNIAHIRNHEVARTRVNQRYMYFGAVPFNDLENVGHAMNIDLKITDISSEVILPQGEVVTASRLKKIGYQSIVKAQQCSQNGSLSVSSVNPAPFEYVAFSFSGEQKNLAKIQVSNGGQTVNTLHFSPRDKNKTTYAFSTLYQFPDGNLSLTFIAKKNTNICLDEIYGIEYIDIDKEL